MPPPTASPSGSWPEVSPQGHGRSQLPNVPQFLVAYFGILKAGCVVVPMNVLFKAGEAAYVLRDCNARMFVTWASVADEAAKVPPMRECRTSWCSTPEVPHAPIGRPSRNCWRCRCPGRRPAPVRPG